MKGASRKAACEVLGISVRTLERWRKRQDGQDMRCGPKTEPKNKLSEAERRKVLRVVNSKEFEGMSPHEIVAILADRGVYLCSEATMYRLLREARQVAHRTRAKEPVKRQPVVRVATKPNQIWSWDITYISSPIRGAFYYLYVVMDVYSRLIVDWQVQEEENAEHASRLIRRAAKKHKVGLDELTLHSDNGAPMKGSTMLATLQSLGIMPSFTRPRVSDDNPFSEALFRTLKYRPNYPYGPFKDIQEARRWVADFTRWYNTEHHHSGICFVRPIERHEGRDEPILAGRRLVYAAAKARHPERWHGRAPRSWKPSKRVCVRARPDGRTTPEVLAA